MKMLVLWGAILAFFFQSSAFARTFEDFKKSGVLKVAVDSTYPPMEFENAKGKVIGFDIDFANMLAKKLGVKAEFVVMPWDGILAGLAGKRYDVIISSMNVTKQRQRVVNFVEYVKMGQVFISKKSGPQVKTINDLNGLVVAVQRDTTSSEAVEKFQKEVNIKAVKTFVAATDTFSALKSNQAQVIVIDEPVGSYYAALDKKTFDVTGQAISPEPVGIAIRKGDQELFVEIDKAVKKMKKDGSFNRIYKKWFNRLPHN
ncbi:ABC transporter substrate-binding protein [Halobacteriovorax sp. GB3]|uniref:ABC transporter substrate-binding protein n=1 Tax=Halobacteriovorax sp. GB3 TaxID=2719615 RepID=UPI002362EFB5|nr:ABC transporter substrate-binding protein [Halobacteriovorax sp. GB3]MDD0852780.1 ABC transporter substrate-binding protein [Halobacteriovorax sp. GB3]